MAKLYSVLEKLILRKPLRFKSWHKIFPTMTYAGNSEIMPGITWR